MGRMIAYLTWKIIHSCSKSPTRIGYNPIKKGDVHSYVSLPEGTYPNIFQYILYNGLINQQAFH